jgi:hypothetical protein
MRIAIYSANIGNYRNELDKFKIDDIYHLPNNIPVDYYLFTDNKNIKSNIWNIINIEPDEELEEHMDKNRNTCKKLKFIIPEIIRKYEYILWIDTKSFKNIHIYIKELLQQYNLNNLLEIDENSIFTMKHPIRSHPKDELLITTKANKKGVSLENTTHSQAYNDIIKNIKFKTPLPDSTFLFYRNNKDNISILNNIYDLLIKYKLRRDQNVFQYSFYEKNVEDKIKIIHAHKRYL